MIKVKLNPKTNLIQAFLPSGEVIPFTTEVKLITSAGDFPTVVITAICEIDNGQDQPSMIMNGEDLQNIVNRSKDGKGLR